MARETVLERLEGGVLLLTLNRPKQRNAWMQHMRSAVDASDAPESDREALLNYFDTAATSLINQPFI